jgi:hypothetical protein
VTAAIVSRWARRYVLASAVFLVCWQAGVLSGTVPRRAEVMLALYGFVLHVVFGKAYSLVPSYFDRDLAFPRAIALQFPLSVGGTLGLLAVALRVGPDWIGAAGATLWGLGVAVFIGTLAWTIRTNPTGRETATSDAKAERQPLDRVANAFVPVALAYLAIGSYETLAMETGLPTSPLGGSPLAVSHLLGAGIAALLVFAIGFRLLPRFLVARPPRAVPAIVLVPGAVAPALLAAHLGGGVWFRLGAILETVAIVGFAIGYVTLFRRSDRRRVGFYGPLLGAASGVAAVGLGLSFAFGSTDPSLVRAHLRLNLLGLLGLTIVGVSFQFYPPAVGRLPGANDRTALAVIGVMAGGLFLQASGLTAGLAVLTTIGELLALVAAVGYAYLLTAAFRAR